MIAAITSPDLDVNTAEADGSTPLLWATYKVDHELVRALLKAGAKANVTNNYGSSPLTEAVKLGDVELARMLLDAGADADSPNPDGQTALMLASNIGSLKIAELLIAKKANVNVVENFRGQTALMWAAAGNHPDVVDLLLKHGANVKPRAKYDDWPRQMTSEPRAQFRPDWWPHRPALRNALRLLSLRRLPREGGCGRQSAEPGRHHAADQRDRHARL